MELSSIAARLRKGDIHLSRRLGMVKLMAAEFKETVLLSSRSDAKEFQTIMEIAETKILALESTIKSPQPLMPHETPRESDIAVMCQFLKPKPESPDFVLSRPSKSEAKKLMQKASE